MSTILDLSNRGFRAWPIEFMQDDKVKELDISINELRFIETPNVKEGRKATRMKAFPTKMEILKAVGNQIEELPTDISQLQHLKHLLLGGNKISDLSQIFSLHNLVQLGLPYNLLQSLPDAFGFTRLLYLDLSYNQLSDRESTIFAIRRCPTLKHLRLKGNPFCLQWGYQGYVTTHLPKLESLDGTNVDSTDFNEAQNEASHEIILEMEIKDLTVVGTNEINKSYDPSDNYYIQFNDFKNSLICSFPIKQSEEQQIKNEEVKKAKGNSMQNDTLSRICKVSWNLNATIEEANWLQNLHLKLLKHSLSSNEHEKLKIGTNLTEDELLGHCMLTKAVCLLDGRSPQVIQETISFTTKYTCPNSVPINIAKASITLSLTHSSITI